MIPDFQLGDTIDKYNLSIQEGKTTPPSKLTEADLITKMDENGIGTDATIHEHINNI